MTSENKTTTGVFAMDSSENIVAFFGRMEDKLEALKTSVEEYKTSTFVAQERLSEKMAQAEEKIKQLFVFHNEAMEREKELNELIKTNRHDIGNLGNIVNHHESTLEEAQHENKKSLANVQESINKLSEKLDENDRNDQALINQQIGKGQWFKAFAAGVGALAGLATVIATLWMIFKG